MVATAASLALTSLPADAATKTFYDGKGTYWWADVTKVKVTNGTKWVTVTADVGSIDIGDRHYLWVDTDPKNAGPEYKARSLPNTEYEKLRRVGSFSSNGKAVAGPACYVQGTNDIYGDGTVVWKIRRSCMKYPGKVRVSVKARYDTVIGVRTDWAPGYKKFSSWVAKG